MSENETLADIRKETEPRFRELLEKHVDSLGHIQAMQQFNQVFDRIEAVEKRERVETATRAATSAINLTDEKWKGEIGNMAKLREALQTIRSNIYRDQSGDLHIAPDIIVEEVIDRALAEPPRNCDLVSDCDKAKEIFRSMFLHGAAYGMHLTNGAFLNLRGLICQIAEMATDVLYDTNIAKNGTVQSQESKVKS